MLITELIDILSDIKDGFGDLEVVLEDEYGNEFDLLEEEINADEHDQICLIGIEYNKSD